MSTNADPAGLPPAPAPEPAAPPAPPVAPPAPEPTGMPEPPTVGQAPAIPQPPIAPPGFSPEEAQAFYERFQRAETRPTQFLATGRQYGYIPEGIDSVDEASEALRMYATWKSEQAAQLQPQPQAQPGMQSPLGQPPAPGMQPEPGMALDPDTIAERVMSMMEERQTAQNVQVEQQQRVSMLQNGVAAVAAAAGLGPEGQQVLLQNVALGIDMAVERGSVVDFSPGQPGQPSAIEVYAGQVLDSLRGIATTQQQLTTQQQIAQHRATAPRTVVPTGAPASGLPPGQRGLAGAAQRVKDAQQARGGF